MANPGTRAVQTQLVTIDVPVKVHDKVAGLAKHAGTSIQDYVATLFMAAYAARTKETGDRDLDASVSRVMMLDAMETTPAEIAAHVGLKPATVKVILKTWRAEMAGRTA